MSALTSDLFLDYRKIVEQILGCQGLRKTTTGQDGLNTYRFLLEISAFIMWTWLHTSQC